MANETQKPLKSKVTFVSLQDGGVELPGVWTAQSRIDVKMPWVKTHNLEMELDRALGGLVISYSGKVDGKEVPLRAIIPMSHVRLVLLAD